MIEVKGVSKSFDGFLALNDLNLCIPKGSVYGMVGPNGAGKSTIIRHMTGTMKPDNGEILFEGQPIFENVPMKFRMAVIPDDVFHFPQATILDMMKFYKGIYPKFDMVRYEAMKEIFSMSEKTSMRRLSKGMLKQVAFWLALCTRPDYMLLDEPVDGLDPVMRRQVWSLILDDTAQYGTTVLVSSHNLRELEDVCDHVGIMDSGKMLLERSLSELQDNIVKVQLVTDNELPKNLPILHEAVSGRVRTLIVRGNQKEISDKFSETLPLFFDLLPLSLEEIFIYELGGVDYAVKNIVL